MNEGNKKVTAFNLKFSIRESVTVKKPDGTTVKATLKSSAWVAADRANGLVKVSGFDNAVNIDRISKA